MLKMKFENLVAHLGEYLAWQCLEEIEKASGIYTRDATGEPEARLAYACRLQDQKINTVVLIAERQKRVS
jgi:hypothetical protein